MLRSQRTSNVSTTPLSRRRPDTGEILFSIGCRVKDREAAGEAGGRSPSLTRRAIEKQSKQGSAANAETKNSRQARFPEEEDRVGLDTPPPPSARPVGGSHREREPRVHHPISPQSLRPRPITTLGHTLPKPSSRTIRLLISHTPLPRTLRANSPSKLKPHLTPTSPSNDKEAVQDTYRLIGRTNQSEPDGMNPGGENPGAPPRVRAKSRVEPLGAKSAVGERKGGTEARHVVPEKQPEVTKGEMVLGPSEPGGDGTRKIERSVECGHTRKPRSAVRSEAFGQSLMPSGEDQAMWKSLTLTSTASTSMSK